MSAKLLAACAASLALASCASIIGKSNYPLNVASNPAEAHFTITDKSGKVIHEGTTPQVVTLKSSHGYFEAERYDIKFDKAGFASKTYTLTGEINGWYFGNLLFGGLIGMLIVDPLTGAMYRLPKGVDVALDGQRASAEPGTLQIVDIGAVPAELRSRLIALY